MFKNNFKSKFKDNFRSKFKNMTWRDMVRLSSQSRNNYVMVFIPSTCSRITSRVSSRITSGVSSRIWCGAIWRVRHLRADSVIWLSQMSSVWLWSAAPKVRLYDAFLGGLRHMSKILASHMLQGNFTTEKVHQKYKTRWYLWDIKYCPAMSR